LNKLRYLRLANLKRLTSLAGIETLASLEELEIHTCRRINSIEEIGSLQRLRKLYLNNNGDIKSLKPLEKLTGLEADIAAVAALSLIRRDNEAKPLPTEIIEIHGPDVITGDSAAALWSEVLGRKVPYPGDDPDAFERQIGAMISSAMAYDVARMFGGFHRDGMIATPGAVDRVTKLLGRPLRTYRSYAEETGKQGKKKK
jgi:hypothetical protein